MSNPARQLDGIKYELINGEIVYMSPRPKTNHIKVSGAIFRIFSNYLRKKPCQVYYGADVFLTEKDEFIPDISVVCDKNMDNGLGITGGPDLVVEVLSKSTAKRDKFYKKDIYAKCGVKEYWIVDPNNCFIEVYILNNGNLEHNETYAFYDENEIKKMTEDAKNAVIKEFKTSLFDDLIIDIEEVFEDVI